MATLHHTCGDCDSKFTIRYDERECEDDPHLCPFCGTYIIVEDDNNEVDE
jgi:DNA-directed RNA polymerase subunit RPC12/RpoP